MSAQMCRGWNCTLKYLSFSLLFLSIEKKISMQMCL